MNENKEIPKEKMLEILDDFEEKIQDLRNILEDKTSDKKQKYLTRIKIIEAIKNEGGIVEQDKYYQIVDKAGMSRQGASAFFAYDGALARIAGNRIAVTPKADDRLKRWREKANRY